MANYLVFPDDAEKGVPRHFSSLFSAKIYAGTLAGKRNMNVRVWRENLKTGIMQRAATVRSYYATKDIRSRNPGHGGIDRQALLDTLKHLNWVFGKGEIQSIEWTPGSSTGGARVKLQYGGQFVKFTIDPTGKYVTFRGHRRKIAAQNPGPSAIPARWTPATVSRKGGQIQIRMGGR